MNSAASNTCSVDPFSFLPAPPPLTFSVLVLLCDVVLCTLVVMKVPYTEIDWEAYMSEVAGYLSGERNYEKVRCGAFGECEGRGSAGTSSS